MGKPHRYIDSVILASILIHKIFVTKSFIFPSFLKVKIGIIREITGRIKGKFINFYLANMDPIITLWSSAQEWK